MFKEIFKPAPTLYKVYAYYGGDYKDRVALFLTYDEAVNFAIGAEHYEILKVK